MLLLNTNSMFQIWLFRFLQMLHIALWRMLEDRQYVALSRLEYLYIKWDYQNLTPQKK
jgi:hypothetical protein